MIQKLDLPKYERVGFYFSFFEWLMSYDDLQTRYEIIMAILNYGFYDIKPNFNDDEKQRSFNLILYSIENYRKRSTKKTKNETLPNTKTTKEKKGKKTKQEKYDIAY